MSGTVLDTEQLDVDLARLDELERGLSVLTGTAAKRATAVLEIVRAAVEAVASEGSLSSSLCTAVVKWRKTWRDLPTTQETAP